MKYALSAILCLCLLVVAMAQQQSDDFLDLTKIPPQRERSGSGKGGGVGGSSQKLDPFKVTLLSLDKRSYQLGDEVIYEVSLENITNDTLVIPWSNDYDRVKPEEETDPPGYFYAYLSLEIKDKGYETIITGQAIYGSQLLSSSLKRLRPGQKIRIRAPGNWRFGNTNVYGRILTKLPQAFEVRARFRLNDPPINSRYEPAVSANSLSVELRKRQQ